MRYLLYIILFLSCSAMSAQEAGVKLLGGISQSKFSNDSYTPKGETHAGYQLGFEITLNSGPSYMVASILFQQDDMIAQGRNDFFDHDFSISWIKLRSGVGFRIVDLGLVDIHGKILGAVNAVSAYPQNSNPLPFNELAPADLNAVFGLHVRLGFVFVGAEYEKGFTKIVSLENGGESKYDTFTLMTGVFF